MLLLGIGLSVVAAVAYALAAALQHNAVRELPGGQGRLSLKHLRTLLTRRRWLLGLAGELVGAGLHVAALSMAPLVVVQPIGVLAIALTTVFSGAKLTRETLAAVLACLVGVGLFVALAAGSVRPAGGAAVLSGGVLPVSCAAVVVLVLAATAAPGRWRCPLYATAAGVAYGTVSALTRVVARQLGAAGLPGVSVLAVFGGVAAILAGAWCVQQAYAAGRADTVQACQTVVDPLVGVLLGVFLFGEIGAPGPLVLTGQLACAGLAVTGVVLLARRSNSLPIPVSGERVLAGAQRERS